MVIIIGNVQQAHCNDMHQQREGLSKKVIKYNWPTVMAARRGEMSMEERTPPTVAMFLLCTVM